LCAEEGSVGPKKAIKDLQQHGGAGRGPIRGREGVPPWTACFARRSQPSSHIPPPGEKRRLTKRCEAFGEGEVLLIDDK
jgi:hypothetical protein